MTNKVYVMSMNIKETQDWLCKKELQDSKRKGQEQQKELRNP